MRGNEVQPGLKELRKEVCKNYNIFGYVNNNNNFF
jgi:hypothetical protein